MAIKLNPDLLLAKTLAAPFSRQAPLSCRSLPDGGMVVVAADGRKLWFSRTEVDNARSELEEKDRREKRLASAVQNRMPPRRTSQPENSLSANVAIRKAKVKK